MVESDYHWPGEQTWIIGDAMVMRIYVEFTMTIDELVSNLLVQIGQSVVEF